MPPVRAGAEGGRVLVVSAGLGVSAWGAPPGTLLVQFCGLLHVPLPLIAQVALIALMAVLDSAKTTPSL